MNLNKNDIIDLSIESISSDGSGIGKYNNMVIFVPNSVIGDKLKIKILKVKKNYAFGKIDKIISPSKDRIESHCINHLKCGGCVYGHVNYETELKYKTQKVKDAISRIGGLDASIVNPIIGAKKHEKYRNKAQIPIGISKNGEYEIGFYAKHSHRIIDCQNCTLQPDIFNNVIHIFRKWLNETKPSIYNEKTKEGLLRHLYIREAQNKRGKELMVCLVINGNDIDNKELLISKLKESILELKSFIININTSDTNVIMGSKDKIIYGRDYITDTLCNLEFNISAHSFYQVNKAQAETVYKLVDQYSKLSKNEILLDLYCGTGTIGLTIANKCKKLIGIEIVDSAVNNAIQNAKQNNITNAEFICSDASKAAKTLYKNKNLPDVIIIDPPRKGCSQDLIETIVHMAPKRIVYVSCDPATLARDLKIFNNYRYITQEVTPVDMFPRTEHVECVVLMSLAID